MAENERLARRLLTVGLAGYGALCFLTPDTYRWLDSLDVAIHEPGHLVFAFGGDFLTALGGTLMQLLMPGAFVVYFWRRGDRHAASVALWWVAQNLWNISRYMADARAQELPLVGGGEHDWAFLLAELDLLARDRVLAGAVRLGGGALALVATAIGLRATARPALGAQQAQPTVREQR
jgi:hypothetical protein